MSVTLYDIPVLIQPIIFFTYNRDSHKGSCTRTDSAIASVWVTDRSSVRVSFVIWSYFSMDSTISPSNRSRRRMAPRSGGFSFTSLYIDALDTNHAINCKIFLETSCVIWLIYSDQFRLRAKVRPSTRSGDRFCEPRSGGGFVATVDDKHHTVVLYATQRNSVERHVQIVSLVDVILRFADSMNPMHDR